MSPATAATLSSPLDEVESAIARHSGRAFGFFRDMRLDSHFQPIYSLAHRRIVGHEALLRAYSAIDRPVGPLQALAAASSDDERVFADRLCRALHLHNYPSQNSIPFSCNATKTDIAYGLAYCASTYNSISFCSHLFCE